MKLADYGVGSHIDARADWCRARGFDFHKVRGDGNCLYGALGKSVGRDPAEIREEIAQYEEKSWEKLTNI